MRSRSTAREVGTPMAKATLTISSKNYVVLVAARLAAVQDGRPGFRGEVCPSDDPSTRAELLLLSPSFLVPCLTHDGVKVWDTLAIAEYLNETQARRRACCRRTARRAPAAARSRRDAFRLQQSALGAADEPQGALSRLQGLGRRAGRHRPHRRDLARVPAVLGGPFLFGEQPSMADAMYAPVCTRFHTYDVKLDAICAAYCEHHHGDAAHAGMDRRRPRPSRRKSRSSTSSSDPRHGLPSSRRRSAAMRHSGAAPMPKAASAMAEEHRRP